MNLTLTRIGASLYALVIGYFGVNHFMIGKGMGGMVPSFLPGGGTLWVYITEAIMVIGALTILINRFARTGAILLAILLLIFALAIHLKNYMNGNEGELFQFLKDLGLAAGAMVIAGCSRN